MGIISHIVDDPVYFLKRNALYAGGKYAAHSVAHPIGETLTQTLISPDVVMQLGGAAAGFGKTAVGLVGVGLASGVSAGLVQVDYYHKRTTLAQQYKDELAKRFNKSPEKVSAGDLDALAKGDPEKGIAGNRAVAEELNKVKKERTLGVVASFLATMAALAVAGFMLPASPSLFHLASATAAEWGTLALNTAVGLGVYNAVKIPLHWVGEKLFGIDKETTHDRIDTLKRDREAGKVISQEQVLSVFVKSRPDIDNLITTRYGQQFDKLDLADKQRAVADIGTLIPLAQLTSDINRGKINVTELAFAVDGKASGVRHEGGRPSPQPRRGLLTRMRHALGFAPHPEVQVIGVAAQSQDASAALAYAEANSGPTFVERLGRPRLDKTAGYTQLLEQLDQQANTEVSQTIH